MRTDRGRFKQSSCTPLTNYCGHLEARRVNLSWPGNVALFYTTHKREVAVGARTKKKHLENYGLVIGILMLRLGQATTLYCIAKVKTRGKICLILVFQIPHRSIGLLNTPNPDEKRVAYGSSRRRNAITTSRQTSRKHQSYCKDLASH